ILVGALSFFRLPVAEYPDIAPPTVFVSTTYIGADASVVNNTVAQIIEQEMNGVGDVEYMYSTVDASGGYELMIVFSQGVDIDTAAVRVQNKLSSVISDLPADVQSHGVTVTKNTPEQVLMVNLFSPNGTLDEIFLKNYATVYFLDKIRRVNGVGSIDFFGGDYSMRIWVNPDKLAELGLTIADVENALKEQNVQAAVGSLGKMPTEILQEREFVGRSTNRKETVADFENIVVKTADGSFVRMKDFARVGIGARNLDALTFRDGKSATSFAVKLTNDANTLETVSAVKKILSEAREDFPPDMEYEISLDATRFIEESLEEVAHTFFEALLLVIIVVWLFLRNLRSTVIALLAVPVSIVATFAVFPFVGFTINTLTLFALILAIGLVVDDAIVVIELVEKNLERGLDVKAATLQAMHELTAPIVAIACVLASVFVPAAFMAGITGELYRQFALTIVVSMIFSTVVALTLTPALCVLILKRREKSSSQIVDKLNNGFRGLLERFMRRKVFVVAILLALTAGAFALQQILPSEYIPEEDKGNFVVAVTLPEGTSLNHTIDTVNKFSAALAEIDAVENLSSIAGMDLLGGGTNSNAGTIFAILKPWDERDESLDEVLERINDMANVIPEAEIFAMNGSSSLPGIESIGAITMILLDVKNHSDEELAALAEKIEAAAEARDELEDVTQTFTVSKPYVDMRVNEDKTKQLGVNLDDVYAALRVNFGGDDVNDFTSFGHVYKVVVQAESNFRDSIDATKFIFVRNESGSLVPLDSLINLQRTTGVAQLSRYNGVRCVSFSANVGEGFSSGEALDALEQVVEEVAPETFQIEWAEQSRQEKLAQTSAAETFVLSLAFVFLCLVALYESWKIPFAVLLSVPTGIFGAFAAEFVTGNVASIYMQIGLLVLIALAAKNAILIVEVAKVKVDGGEDVERAAIDSAAERLRPIVMTSLAFVVACVPLMLATGAGSAARNSMGAAVVGGMFLATVLGIFVVPVLFACVSLLSFGSKRK
ncbi:MAG: efflux RND transporter permease subunit, partial [Selenomonadaceae bacterium]|nr:efflux RND transporter permease subunit [Selenomonadaceae bacterium]